MSFFLSFLIGVVLFYSFLYFPFSTVFIAFLSIISLFLKKKYFLILILIFGTAFAFLRYGPQAEIPRVKDKIAVKGVFESYPAKTEKGNFKQTFIVTSVENMNTAEKAAALAGREIVLLADRIFEPGTECEIAITLLKSRKRLNPGELSGEETYANLSDIYSEKAGANSFYSRIQEYRYRINKYIEENLEKDPGAFVASITTGQMTNMSEELKDAFNVTGLAHILSISGSHFGLFSVFLFGVFSLIIKAPPYRILQRVTLYVAPSQAAALLCIPFMLAYLGLSGAGIPATRSFIMISLFLFGLIIGKKGYWLNSLLFAAFIIVVWEPESIFNISFQLSFLAVLFIGFSLRDSDREKKGGGKIFRYFKSALLMTLSASAGTAPLVAYYFHYFSVISPISNLVAAPLIGFLLIPLSVVSCFLYLITGHFLFTPLVSFFSGVSIAFIRLLAGVPYAGLSVPAFPPVLLILFYGGFVPYLLIDQLSKRNDEYRSRHSSLPGTDGALTADSRLSDETKSTEVISAGNDLPEMGKGSLRILMGKKGYMLGLPLIPIVLYFFLLNPENKGLRVTFLDVGQGDAAVTEFPDGKIMVIDTGRTGRETASFLKYRGKKIVDVLVLSHVHPDHTGGLDVIQRKFQVKEIWDNGRIVYPDNRLTHSLSRGDTVAGTGYRVYVLHPYTGFYTMEKSECVSQNNDSLVLKIEGKNLSFLFTGDIEEEAEENIFHLGKWLKSNVLKVPHHGGKTSVHGPFLTAVSPETVVISAGRDNSFGHPHQETLDALEGTHIFRTDIDGAVKISESEKGVEIKTYRESRLRQAVLFSDEMKNFVLLGKTW